MVNTAVTFAVFLIGLGITEVYLKPLAVWAVTRSQRILAGKVLERLDPIFPSLIADCTPEQLTDVVKRELEAVSRLEDNLISERLAERVIASVFSLYNPLINAEKLSQGRVK